MEERKHTVVISIGSNVADARQRVADAIALLVEMLPNGYASEVYVTPGLSDPDRMYANAVVWGESVNAPEELGRRLKEMEYEFGRTPEMRSRGDVPLDLDIVIADGIILRPKDFNRHYFQLGWQSLRRRPC